MVAACGGGSDKPKATPVAPGGTSAATRLKASALVPQLSDLGYSLTDQGSEPAPPGQDIYGAQFAKGGGKGAVVKSYVMPDENSAKSQFGTLAAALRNPPPGFIGSSASFVDTPSPQVGDDRKSYQTSTVDSQGLRAWSDIYRFGQVITIVQFLDSGTTDQMAGRKAIAERVQALTR